MPTYVFYGYSANALAYNPGTNSFDLRADYTYSTDRIIVTVTDDDAFFDGDNKKFGDNEIGSDFNQTAVITSPDGTVLGSGRVYDEAYAEIGMPGGGFGWLERVEIGGQHFGYLTNVPLQAGQSYPLNFSAEVVYPNTITYGSLYSVPCFGPDTRIATPMGPRAIRSLRRGDLVLTRDHGPRPVAWVMASRPPAQATPLGEDTRPLVIRRGTLGQNQPNRDLIVSPDHRILVASAQAQLCFAAPEVFVAAKALVPLGMAQVLVQPPGWRYWHLLCNAHEIVLADGIWTETLLPGPQALRRLGPWHRLALSHALPASPIAMRAARPCLVPSEARLLWPPRPHRHPAA